MPQVAREQLDQQAIQDQQDHLLTPVQLAQQGHQVQQVEQVLLVLERQVLLEFLDSQQIQVQRVPRARRVFLDPQDVLDLLGPRGQKEMWVALVKQVQRAQLQILALLVIQDLQVRLAKLVPLEQLAILVRQVPLVGQGVGDLQVKLVHLEK